MGASPALAPGLAGSPWGAGLRDIWLCAHPGCPAPNWSLVRLLDATVELGVLVQPPIWHAMVLPVPAMLGDTLGTGQALAARSFPSCHLSWGAVGKLRQGPQGWGRGRPGGGGVAAPAGPRAQLSRLPPWGLFIARAAMCRTCAVAWGGGWWVQTRLCSMSLPFAMLEGHGGPCPLATPWGQVGSVALPPVTRPWG